MKMPRTDKAKPWSTQEINKVLRFLDDNFDLWNQNHTLACDKAIETLKIDRDSKSVNNKIYNMMKAMDDKDKKKSSVSLQSRITVNLLKSLRNKSNKVRGEITNTNEVLSQMSSLNITDNTTEMADNFTETVNNKNKQLKILTDEINKKLTKIEEMEEEVSKHHFELEELDKKAFQHRSKVKEIEEGLSKQRSGIKEMEDEKKELEKFFAKFSKKQNNFKITYCGLWVTGFYCI